MFKEDDDEYAPGYLLLPSGGKANRVFIAGTLISKEDRDGNYAFKINDSTGEFALYAGQYQPEAAEALRDIDTPAYVSVVGKPDTFEGDDGTILSTIRPERVAEITKEQRDKWVAETAQQTLDRLNKSPEEDDYAKMAEEHHGEERMDLADVVVNALEELQNSQQ
jgi:hypothetical protein